MRSSVLPVAMIFLAGLTGGVIGWFANPFASEPFLHFLGVATAIFGVWIGLFAGAFAARRVFRDSPQPQQVLIDDSQHPTES